MEKPFGNRTDGHNAADVSMTRAVSSPREASSYLMTKKGYLHPMKTYVEINLLVVGVMSAVWFVLGAVPGGRGTIPPAFAFGPSDWFFHSIGIGLTALIVCFVVTTFEIDKREPNIDFPIAYRATLASIIGAVAVAFYLSPAFNSATAPITDIIMLIALLLLGDVGGALIVQFYLLPAKLSQRYHPESNVLGMFPRLSNLPTWRDFRRMSSAYWLVFATIISAFLAGIMGFIAFWVNPHHVFIAAPSFLDGYMDWLGGASAFTSGLIGSHSHVIGMTVILGVVAVAAQRFGALDLSSAKRTVAKFGMWLSVMGITVMTFVYLLEAFVAYSPPLLFASNPGGFELWSFTASNGLAGDDSTMFLASLGAIFLLVPLMLTQIRGRPAWKDPLRMSILATWVFAYVASVLEGFYIEFNEATLSGGATDLVFGEQQYFAIFGITIIAAAFLAVDYFQDRRGTRSVVAGFGVLVTLLTLVAGFAWAYLDPGSVDSSGALTGTTTWGWVYAAGLMLVSVAVIVTLAGVFKGEDEPITPSTAQG